MSDYDLEQRHLNCRVDGLLNQLPEDVRGIGEEVLHTIACGKKLLSWNNKLQLIIDGRAIPNTNIVELVEYILYPEGDENADLPPGFDTFIKALKGIGLESQWVRNERVIEALDNNENEWDTTDSESSEEDGESDVEQTSDSGEVMKNNHDYTDAREGDAKANTIKWKNISSDDE